jgi:nitrogen regulatory protein P-II 1
MKLIKAIIRKEKLNNVLKALFDSGIHGVTVRQVTGHGGESEKIETYRGTTVKIALKEKIQLEIGVSDHFTDLTVQTIMHNARTGEVGDGKIFVLPIEKVYRIRTGAEDEDAVTPEAQITYTE